LASGKPPRRQRREHIGTGKGAETLPDVCPLYVAEYKLPEMTSGEVDVYRGDDQCRQRAQHEAWQRKHKVDRFWVRHLHLYSSTLANGSAAHGRKRLIVNLVFCPGFTFTSK
jgi:hypothetical protein